MRLETDRRARGYQGWAVWLATAAAATIFWAAAEAAVGAQSRADRRLQDRLDDANRREAETLVELADDAMDGKREVSDFAIAWRHDFLKAQPGTFVPFTVTIDRSRLEAAEALMYVRAVRRAGTAGPPGASEGKGFDARYAFDAVFPVALGRSADSLRVSRGFAVAPGEYDVYIVVRERPADPLGPRQGRMKAAVLRQPITVPDYWTGELATSTVMLANRIDVLPQPLDPDEALERPYVIGQNDVHLAGDSTFRKGRDREVIVVFVVYNPTVESGRHFDVRVDYHLFHRERSGSNGTSALPPPGAPPPREGERYVTRTDPQRFNPGVLGPRVNPAAGHPLMAGQGILLSSFAEGEYRLGITITDLLSRKTILRDVTFTVAGS